MATATKTSTVERLQASITKTVSTQLAGVRKPR